MSQEIENQEQEKKELNYGQSPFDDWSREDLLKFARRAYYALVKSKSIMDLMQAEEVGENNPFWKIGSGYRTSATVEVVLQDVHRTYEPGDIYNSFYRPALPMIYEDVKHLDGSQVFEHWWICDKCGYYVSPANEMSTCDRDRQPLRKMTLADVEEWSKKNV